MEFSENTKLADILAAYPWLPEAAAKLDKRLEIINSPLVKMFIRRATLADASKRSGYPVDEIIREMKKLIDEHERNA
jgi:hypothetical protein